MENNYQTNEHKIVVSTKHHLKSKRNNNFLKAITIAFASFIALLAICFVIYIAIEGSIPFINGSINIFYFLFGTTYYPSDGLYAAGFMLINTIWVSTLSILVALPIALFTAIVITKSKIQWVSRTLHTTTSVLAAIPSIIYGVFGSFVINGIISAIFGVGGGTVLAVVLTLSTMIVPTMTVVIINSIRSLDKNIEYGSFALGATQSQTNFRVTLRAIKGGITAGALLGVGRALGEATAVSLVATSGFTGPTFNLFEPIRLLTATMLQGFGELSPSELQIRFSMGMLLIAAIIIVFATVRFINYRLSDTYSHSKLSKSYAEEERIMLVESEIGYENMTSVERNYFDKYSLIRKFRIKNLTTIDNFQINDVKPSTIYRKQNSRRISVLTYTFASVGLIILLVLLGFLLIEGLGSLNFHFLSSQYSDYDFTISASRELDGGTFVPPQEDIAGTYYYLTNWGFALEREVLSDGTIAIWIKDIDQNSPIKDAVFVDDIGSITTLGDPCVISEKDPVMLGNVININGDLIAITDIDLVGELINEASEFTVSLVYRNHGIAGSIWTTMLLVVLTMIVTIPIGIMVAIYFAEYAAKSRFTSFLKTMIDLLAGIPSLLFGLVGTAVLLVFIPSQYVIFAASILMSVILLPTVVMTTEEALKNVPESYKHASIGLGASNARTIWKIKLPYVAPSIISSSILLIGRVIGETAALVMILGFMPNDSITFGPSTTLSTQIWGSMQGEVADYGTACAISLVILFLIFMLFVSAEHINKKHTISASIVFGLLILFLITIALSMYVFYLLVLLSIFGWFLFETINAILRKKNYKLDIRYRWKKHIDAKKLESSKLASIAIEDDSIEFAKKGNPSD